MIVDIQNYYLKKDSSYFNYFNAIQPGCLDYIITRCESTVINNIQRLLEYFRSQSRPVIYLRLCGKDPDRNDLHWFFKDTYLKGKRAGLDNVYPLENDRFAEVVDDICPFPEDTIINKTTFSPFTRTAIDDILRNKGIEEIIFTGLATSQCVETTARDASDRGYRIIHIEDAQADYDELSHSASLYSSQGICGGYIYSTDEYIKMEMS